MRYSLCFLLILSLSASGATKKTTKKATDATAVAKVLLQMERDWSQAGVSKDRGTMDRIMADDWVSVDFHGKTVTKAQALAELRSPRATEPIELGEMKIRVIGATAIVTGADKSGTYAWMDVFMKRNGRWQAVASQSTKVER